MSNDFDFDKEGDAKPATRGRREGGSSNVAIALFVVGILAIIGLLGSAAAYVMYAAVASSRVPQKNRDYLEILELKYKNAAMLAMSIEWSDQSFKEFPAGLYGDNPREMLEPVFIGPKVASDLLEEAITTKRLEFVNRHGVESGDWVVEFRKSYPERDVIFDEIKTETRRIVRDQVRRSSSELLLEKKFKDQQFCRDYFRSHASKFKAEVENHAANLPSIQSLRKKVKSR